MHIIKITNWINNPFIKPPRINKIYLYLRGSPYTYSDLYVNSSILPRSNLWWEFFYEHVNWHDTSICLHVYKHVT